MMAHEVSDRATRLAVWQSYLQIHDTVTSLLESPLVAEQDLPLLWYNALEQLQNADDHSMRLQDLAEAVKLSQSGVTRLLDRMAESGLVERRPCEHDRRGLFAHLLAEGEEKLAAARPVYQHVLDEHFLRYLSCDEVKALDKVFSNIVQLESNADADLAG